MDRPESTVDTCHAVGLVDGFNRPTGQGKGQVTGIEVLVQHLCSWCKGERWVVININDNGMRMRN